MFNSHSQREFLAVVEPSSHLSCCYFINPRMCIGQSSHSKVLGFAPVIRLPSRTVQAEYTSLSAQRGHNSVVCRPSQISDTASSCQLLACSPLSLVGPSRGTRNLTRTTKREALFQRPSSHLVALRPDGLNNRSELNLRSPVHSFPPLYRAIYFGFYTISITARIQAGLHSSISRFSVLLSL